MLLGGGGGGGWGGAEENKSIYKLMTNLFAAVF